MQVSRLFVSETCENRLREYLVSVSRGAPVNLERMKQVFRWIQTLIIGVEGVRPNHWATTKALVNLIIPSRPVKA